MTKQYFFSSVEPSFSVSARLQQIIIERKFFSIDLIQRQRPYLFNEILNHVGEDGEFSLEFISSGKLELLFSFIEDEKYLSEIDYIRLNQIIDKTIEIGLMGDDYTWLPTTTKTQIAMWVEMLTNELHIPHKWRWAEARYGITNLKQARSNTKNQYGKVFNEEFVVACFR